MSYQMHSIMRGRHKQRNPHKRNCISTILNYLVTKSYRTYVCVRVFVIYCIFCCFAYFFFHRLHPVYILTYPLFDDMSNPSYIQIYPILPYPTLLLRHKILFTHYISHSHPYLCLLFPSLLHFIIQFTLSLPYPTLPYTAIF